MDSQVAEVKTKTDIIEIAGQYATLKRSGRNFKGLCPFHQEKTPSFMVSPELQIWHCFGACSQGGDVISFLMKAENISFIEALRELAEKAGVRLKSLDFEDRNFAARNRIFKINKITAQFYNYILTKHKSGRHAIDYLKKRNLSKKLINTFLIGYSPNSWNSLIKFLRKKGYHQNDLISSGLAVQSEKGSVYDRFRGRIMFPLFDHRDNIAGFSGRIITDEKTAKYINSPETLVYHKRETLYGINQTKHEIKKQDRAIIVEGEFDLLSCLSNAVANVVAVKGSAVTKEQLKLLKRFCGKITFALDSDFSGDQTVNRTINDAEELDFEISAISYEYAKDPDEALQKDPIIFKKLLEKPTAIYDFIINKEVKKNPGEDAISKKRIADVVIPYLINIKNPILYSYYTKRLAKVLNVDIATINSSIAKYKREKIMKKIVIPKSIEKKVGRYELLQKYILSTILKSKNIFASFDKVFSILKADDFEAPAYKKIIDQIEKFRLKIAKNKEIDINALIKFIPSELLPSLKQIYLFDIEIFSGDNTTDDIEKSALQLRKLSLKNKIKSTVSYGQDSKNNQIIKKLTTALADVEKKLAVV